MVVFWLDVVDEMWHVFEEDLKRGGVLVVNRMPLAHEIVKLNM
jgi:hypothetical protein